MATTDLKEVIWTVFLFNNDSSYTIIMYSHAFGDINFYLKWETETMCKSQFVCFCFFLHTRNLHMLFAAFDLKIEAGTNESLFMTVCVLTQP